MEVLAEHGVGGLVVKTISVTPARVPRLHMGVVNRGEITYVVPHFDSKKLVIKTGKIRISYYGFLNAGLWSNLPPEQWFNKELPYAKSVATKHGIPLIASIGYKATS